MRRLDVQAETLARISMNLGHDDGWMRQDGVSTLEPMSGKSKARRGAGLCERARESRLRPLFCLVLYLALAVRPRPRTRRTNPFLTLASTPPTTAPSPFQTADQSAQAVAEKVSQEKNTDKRATHGLISAQNESMRNTKKQAVKEKHARYNARTRVSYLANSETSCLAFPSASNPDRTGKITAIQMPKIVTTNPAKPIKAF